MWRFVLWCEAAHVLLWLRDLSAIGLHPVESVVAHGVWRKVVFDGTDKLPLMADAGLEKLNRIRKPKGEPPPWTPYTLILTLIYREIGSVSRGNYQICER